MPALGVVVVGAAPGLARHVGTVLSGIPVAVRSVRALAGISGIARVDVLCVGPGRDVVDAACAGLSVCVHEDVSTLLRVVDGFRAHGGQRPGATEGDGPVTPDVVVVHDALRPLVPVTLGTAVIAAVRNGWRAVVPTLPLSDTVKQVDAAGRPTGTPDRSGLRVVQTPQAFTAGLAADVLHASVQDPVRAWTGAGGMVHTVPGDPLAFPVHEAWDLDLAVAALDRAGPS